MKSINMILRCFAVCLGFSGCLIGPDFVTPKAPVAEGWANGDDAKVEHTATDPADWWTVFNDPALNDVIEKAFHQNLTLQVAGLRILEARANLGIAAGEFFPQIQELRGSVADIGLSKHGANQGLLDRHNTNYFGSFDAAWEIDFWGRYRRGIESADASFVASVASYDDALVSLTAEVARTYVLIRTFQQRLELARSNEQIQRRSLQIAEIRFRNGQVTELDVTQARSLLADTQALIPRAITGIRQGMNALSVLLGLPPYDLSDILTGPQAIPEPPDKVLVGMPADLLRRRPDIRQAEFLAAAQSARIGIAKTELFPRISLFGTIGLQTHERGGSISNNSDLGDFFSFNSVFYSMGPKIEWPILNYGRLKNNVRMQDARLQQLIVNYKNTVLKAAQEVEDGLVGFLRSSEEAAHLTESVEAAKRSVRLSLIQYRDGLVDYQRVLNSQESLVQAQDRMTVARGNVVVNLISTYKALGGGWMMRQGQEFVPVQTQQVMGARTDWGDLLRSRDLEEEASDEAAPRVRMPDF